MSGLEIERKFLVRKTSDWKSKIESSTAIIQGYIPANGATVRIRLRDGKGYLTIKSPSKNGLSRYEFEKEITRNEAENLLNLCARNKISKCRYVAHIGQHVWEIDEFYGENHGLVMAEVELKSEDEEFELPDFAGAEVTFDKRFRNAYLISHPFSKWKNNMPDIYR